MCGNPPIERSVGVIIRPADAGVVSKLTAPASDLKLRTCSDDRFRDAIKLLEVFDKLTD